jgi:hypothetical protein
MSLEITEIFKLFEINEIDYCVLRNYDQFTEKEDIDILVNEKRKLKIIFSKLNFKKGAEYGNYLSINGNYRLDFKVGAIPYWGFSYSSSKELIKRKRRFGKIYVLSYEDELIHLLLHSILDKNCFSEIYKNKIELLIKKSDFSHVSSELKNKFGGLGKKLSDWLLAKDYRSLLSSRRKMFLKIFSIRGLIWLFCILSVRTAGNFFSR